MPSLDRLLHMQCVIIPYRLRAITFGKTAIDLERKYGSLEMINVMVDSGDGSQASEFRGALIAITQPAVSIAVIHSRCLLEFLGMGVDGSSKAPKLSAKCKARRKGDVGIEHFSDSSGLKLQVLTPDLAAELLGRKCEAPILNLAWAKTYAIANQRLAHSTDDAMLVGSNPDHSMGLTFETIPELVCRALYDKIGEPRPSLN